MDLKQLEVFYSVYEEQSFSKAARRLGLSQPTISSHIKALEEHFGTPLLDRLGRQTLPTRAGEFLYQQSRQMLEMKRVVAAGMSRFRGGLEGELELGASTIPGEYLLPPWLSRLHRLYPKIRIRLQISDTEAVTRAVSEGRIELGFVGAKLTDGDLEFQKFASDRLVLAVPATPRWELAGSVSLNELKEEPLVIREPGSGTRIMMERQLNRLGHGVEDFNVVAELGSTTAIKEAIKAKVGGSVLSHFAIRDETASGLVKTVAIAEIEAWERDFYVVVNRRRFSSPICETFLEMVAS